MPFLLRNLKLKPGEDEIRLLTMVALTLGVELADLLEFRIQRKAVDARKKPDIKLVYTVCFSLADETAILKRLHTIPDLEQLNTETPLFFNKCSSSEAIVIAGMGPAGLFCALRLNAYGIRATVVERGKPVDLRVRDVANFWKDGLLDSESNVQFGEGGAGTFSDGKLTCRIRDPNTTWVIKQLVNFGAPSEILYQAKPHIGTDRLRSVVISIRNMLVKQGFAIRFSTRLTGLICKPDHPRKISAVQCNNSEELLCSHLVLAIGHSARDTYSMLVNQNLLMEAKPFAIGLRVEHQQELIDRIQYGKSHPALPRADYALTWNNPATGRSCYSFCNCPGGQIIGASSEPEMLVVNGMSNFKRDSGYANSALVVNVRPEDFFGSDPLAGVRFQQYWEHRAFLAGGGKYCAPSQNLLEFIGAGKGTTRSSYHPCTVEADLSTLVPDYVTATLREGIVSFDRKMKGFITAEATLTGLETRTSAPLRIIRDEYCQSPVMGGIYPCGEGAGYAGGIISAALDGVRIADIIAGQMQD